MAGRIVVVTGASAGIGRAAARAFAAHGDDVALLARGEAGLEAAAKEVQSAGGRAVMVPTDVADHEQVEGAAFIVEQELGPIDVWVNNAFSSVFAPSWDTSAEEFRRLTDVTYLGYVWGTNAALRRMRPRNRGTVVQVGSAPSSPGLSHVCRGSLKRCPPSTSRRWRRERSSMRPTTPSAASTGWAPAPP